MSVNQFLSIDGENIAFEIELLNILDLKYYPENPRISSILERYEGNATQDNIEQEMWDKLEYITHELYRDIKANGGLQEEIIVYNGEVLEGNSRLCAYRHLHKNEPDEEKWKTIRAKVIKSPINNRQLNTLLCQQHIKGKKDWDPFEKAAYMQRMEEQDGMSIEDIARLTKFTKNDVRNNISAYKFMKSEGVTDIHKFSYYLELEKNQKLGSIRKKEPNLNIKISKWIKEGRIPEARDIRKLPDILNDRKSKNKFENQNEDFDVALGLAKTRNPSIEDNFYRKIDETANILKKAKPDKLREEIKEDKRKKYKIRNLAKQIKKLCMNLEIKF